MKRTLIDFQKLVEEISAPDRSRLHMDGITGYQRVMDKAREMIDTAVKRYTSVFFTRRPKY
jgi:hypothetical protein